MSATGLIRVDLASERESACLPIPDITDVLFVRRDVRLGDIANVHSITSSARASSDGGTVRPSAFDVIRLMTRSKSRKYGRRGVPSAYKTFSLLLLG
jgi:hypothetical protein